MSNIKKALKDLEKACWGNIQLEIQFEEPEFSEISEIGVILDYGLERSQLNLMEDHGLKFIKKGGVKFYNELEFRGYDDQLFCTVNDDN